MRFTMIIALQFAGDLRRLLGICKRCYGSKGLKSCSGIAARRNQATILLAEMVKPIVRNSIIDQLVETEPAGRINSFMLRPRHPFRALWPLCGLVPLLAVVVTGCTGAQTGGPDAHVVENWLRSVSNSYAYREESALHWDRWIDHHATAVSESTTQNQLVQALEQAVLSLCDHHATLNVNNANSPRLIPSGIDAWPNWDGSHLRIEQVRPRSGAANAGLRPGMLVLKVNEVPVREALEATVPAFVPHTDRMVQDYAARMLFAGRRDKPLSLHVLDKERRELSVEYMPKFQRPERPLDVSRIGTSIGVITIHNSLGDIGLVDDFDQALATLHDVQALVIDLRDTPSGGNMTVARGIMSRFVARAMPYQRHEYPADEQLLSIERLWVEYVLPRGPQAVDLPIAVLIGRWTGSMGEGLAIGLRDAAEATLIGTRMAGLRGAVSPLRFASTRISLNLPTERLYSIDGVPRELADPDIGVYPEDGESPEVFAVRQMQIAVKTLSHMIDPNRSGLEQSITE